MNDRPRDDDTSASDGLSSLFGGSEPPQPDAELPPSGSLPPVPPVPAGPWVSPVPLIEPEAPQPVIPAFLPPPVSAGSLPTEPTPRWDQPTELFAVVPAAELPTEALPTQLLGTEPSAVSEATELLGVTAPEAAPPGTGADSDSALDSLFGEQNFRDYAVESPAPPRPEDPVAPVIPPGTLGHNQKILLGIGGGFVAVLALIALFLLGTRLPAILTSAPAPTPTASETPTPSPTFTVLPAGPVEPGLWAWDELLGGECLDPFTDPWDEEFTVVDCAAEHPAQLVLRGTFAPTVEGVFAEPYPGAEALQSQLSLLCTASGVLDLALAGQYPDVQVQGTYPATAEQWDAGDRSYYCFVSRSSGDSLTGSVAGAPTTEG